MAVIFTNLFVLLFSFYSLYPQHIATISGKVIYSDKPATPPAATVEIYITATSSKVASQTTTHSFSIDLPPRIYDIVVKAAGYNDATLEYVVLEPDQKITDLELVLILPMSEIILDDATPEAVTWKPDIKDWAHGMSPGFFGEGYRYASTKAVPDKFAIWNVKIIVPGTYEIYGWWVAGGNRPNVAYYIIDGTEFTANQEVGGARWNKLGVYEFKTPGVYNITQPNKAPPADSDAGALMVDAIRLVNITYTPTPPAAPLTLKSRVDGNTIVLEWPPSAGDVLGYKVYRSTAAGIAKAKALAQYMPIAVGIKDTKFIDKFALANRWYFYCVTAYDSEYEESLPSIEVREMLTMSEEIETRIHGNKINPLKGEKTKIVVHLNQPDEANLTVKVYNIAGEIVSVIASETKILKGENKLFHWEGKNDKGEVVPSGLYLIHIYTPATSRIEKVIVLK